MKIVPLMLSLLLSLAVILPAQAQAPELDQLDIVQRSVPAGPVALVRGAPVSRDHFLRFYDSRLASVTMMKKGEPIDDTIRVRIALGVLAELVQREVLLQEAKKRNISVSDADVEAAFKKEMGEFQAQLAQENETTLSEADILARFGQTREEAKADLQRSLLVRKLREHLSKEKKIQVSDADVKKFYDEHPELFQRPGMVHLQQIYMQPKPNAKKADEAAWADTEQRMKKAIARIRAGESFAAVARDMSESPDKGKGGDMGTVPLSKLPEFFAREVAKLKKGDMSEIFRSKVGVHLIQLLDNEGGNSVPLEDARKKIHMVLLESKTEEAVDKLCEPIVADPTKVAVFLQLERTLAAVTGNPDPFEKP